jgi:hypothetical protein
VQDVPEATGLLIPGCEVYQEWSRDAGFCLSRSHWQADGSPVLLQTPGAEPKPKRLALGQTLSLPLTGMLRLYFTETYDCRASSML